MIEYELSESSKLDFTLLTNEEIKKFKSFTSERRKHEFYYTRVLLKTFSSEFKIEYKSTGKPVIDDGHISISHSQTKVIIGYSREFLIGVDIEFIKPKIHRIKHKFLSRTEKNNLDIEDSLILTIIWSIKEAIYKMEDIPGLMFKDHIHIESINEPGEVKVKKNGQYHHYYFRQVIDKEYVITYCHLDV